jgi:hypothetical protein
MSHPFLIKVKQTKKFHGRSPSIDFRNFLGFSRARNDLRHHKSIRKFRFENREEHCREEQHFKVNALVELNALHNI